MAGNYIVIGSKFKPFSYQEMLAPVQMADTEHKAIEEASAEMAAKAGMWGQLANEQTDPQAYNMYQTFANDLAAQADALARQGLTPGSRKALNTMRERYSQEIIPIENAYNRRKEFIDEQRKAMAQDNSVMFNFNAGNASLDQFINNPSITYQTASGNALRQQAGDIAKNLSREMRENPRTWRSILGNQYYETLMKKGYTSEEILAAIAQDPNAAPALNAIIDQVIRASNVNTWNDPEALERARQYAAQGLWNAIGDVQHQTLSNKAYDYAMQDYYRRRKDESSTGPTPPYTTHDYFSISGVSKTDKQGIKSLLGDDKIDVEDISTLTGKLSKRLKGQSVGSAMKTSRELDRLNSMIRSSSDPNEIEQLKKEKAKVIGDIFNNPERTAFTQDELQLLDKLNLTGEETPEQLGRALQSYIKNSSIRYGGADLSLTDNKWLKDLLTSSLVEDRKRGGKSSTLYKLDEDLTVGEPVRARSVINDEGELGSDIQHIRYIPGIKKGETNGGWVITDKSGNKYYLDANKISNEFGGLTSLYRAALNDALDRGILQSTQIGDTPIIGASELLNQFINQAQKLSGYGRAYVQGSTKSE